MLTSASCSTLLSFMGALSIVACAHGIDVAPDNTGAAGSAGTGRGGASGASSSSLTGVTVGSSGAPGTGGLGSGGAGVTGGTTAVGTGGVIGDASAGSGGASGGAIKDGGGVIDVVAEPPPPPFCPTCPLRVRYICFQDGATVQGLEFGVRVANASAAPIALNTITLRYWYTVDGTGTQQPNCIGAALGCPAVSRAVTVVTPARPMADAYVQIGFVAAMLDGGTMLAPNTETGEIRISIAKTNAVSFNQANDYSFRSTGANYFDAPNITAYVGGTLVWGTEPPP